MTETVGLSERSRQIWGDSENASPLLMAEVIEGLARMENAMTRTFEHIAQMQAQTNAQIARLEAQSERTQAQVDQTSRELRVFTEEMRTFRQEMNRKWGELSNKMGTMAEDLVAPSIPGILRTVVGCPHDAIEFSAVRVRRRHPQTGKEQEFDVMAVCGEYVLINETRSKLWPEHIGEFVDRMGQAREFFPEYKDRKFIGAIASLYVDPSLVRHGERQGLIVLGFGEDVMEVLNSPGFTPRVF